MEQITYQQAKDQGLKRYFTGKPCKHGHLSERLVSNRRCCECHATRQLKVYHAKSPEEKLEYNRANARTWEQRKAANLRYERKMYRESLEFRLKKCLRSRFFKAMSRKQRGPTMAMVGCSFSVFRQHLESQFTDGMSWDNYGDWEIDHIIPCAAFDLTDVEQQKRCFHFTNLQPLWRTDNRKKSCKVAA